MAVTCARCGTQNPDGNQFCQACGTPLGVAAPPPGVGAAVPPAPGAPPAQPPPPGGYQSPYYAPSAVGPQPPVHRTPWILIIGAIVVLVVIMAGGGTVILGHRSSGNQGGSSGILPSPSPRVTPSPSSRLTPSPTSTPTTSGAGTASNKGETFILPSGWTVTSKDDQSITITNANRDGSVTIESGFTNSAQSAQQDKTAADKYFQGLYPDTKDCTGSKTTTGSFNGPSGIFWELCFTLSQGGQSIPAEAALFVGANSDGSVYYDVVVISSQSNIDSFGTEATPILKSIKWNLT
jgi:hypothetical protein